MELLQLWEKRKGRVRDDSFHHGLSCQRKKWMDEHTINVTSIKTYKYEQGKLTKSEIYTGKCLEDKFGLSNITKVETIPIDTNVMDTISIDGESFVLTEGNEKVSVTEKAVVLTTADNPYDWWNDGYSYPQWAWAYVAYGIYEREDPINLVWPSNTVSTVKSEMLDEGWTDYPTQYSRYVADPQWGWAAGDGVADSVTRPNGGYHVRLWQMSSGAVVANAHHDTASPHTADQYETAEEHVAYFYNGGWTVYMDNYDLDNYISSPYNNGWATRIYES